MRSTGRLLSGWRGLAKFWAGLLLVIGIGAGVLELLGPRPAATITPGRPAASNGPAITSHVTSSLAPVHPERPGRDTPGPVADADAALEAAYAGDATHKLPKISADGRTPMAVYAAGFNPSIGRPRVGMLIAGIGQSEAASLSAIGLPSGVSLAVSPYSGDIKFLLDSARAAGHEYLLSIPMEPQGYPVNDPDDRHALMTAVTPADNLIRLRWVLSRLTGYVGVTSALGPLLGDRLVGVSDQFSSVLEEVGQRGLLFVDARSGHPALPYVWSRSVDVVIDEQPLDAAALDQRLDQLTHTALDKGSALGIVWVPRPVTLARVAAWTNTLATKGVALAPVSALVVQPARAESER